MEAEKLGRGERIIVTGLLILTLFLSTIPLTSASESKSERDYVTYITTENYPLTIIEGIVVDNETGELIENAGVMGEVHSEFIPIDLRTDELGEFRVVLPNSLAPGSHQFQLTVSSIGYDSKTIVGEIKRGESKRITIKLDYNPFEISMDGGSMSRGWNPYTYTVTRSNPITRTRKVVDHYATRKIYGTRQVFTRRYKKKFRGYGIKKMKVWCTKEVTKKRWVPGHCETRHHWVWKPIKVCGVTTGYYPSYESYQKWVPGYWKSYTTTDWYQDYAYVNVKIYDRVPIYRTERYVKRTERYPVYRRQRYTAYRNRRYRVTDYQVEDWGSKEIPITITGKNGYEGSVTLTVQADKGIDTSLPTSTVNVASETNVILTVSPSSSISGSTHTITVTATDGSVTKTAAYSLDLHTKSKPSATARLIRRWTSDTLPNQTGTTTTTTNSRQDETVNIKRRYVKLSIFRHTDTVEQPTEIVEDPLYNCTSSYFGPCAPSNLTYDTVAAYKWGNFNATLETPEFDNGP